MTDWYFRPFKGLTGGGDGHLDSEDGSGLKTNDGAFVLNSTEKTLRAYILDETSAAAESSPATIAPDANPGDKRWLHAIWPLDYIGNYSHGGSNASTRNITSRLQDSISIYDYGAVSNNNSAGAINRQAISDAANAAGNNNSILIPAGGNFYVSGSNLTISSQVKYDGQLTLDSNTHFKDGNVLKFSEFKKRYATDQAAFEAMLKTLYGNTTTEPKVLDGEGLYCELTDEVDVYNATGVSSYTTWHEIKNFNFKATGNNNFTTTTFNQTCTHNSITDVVCSSNNTTNIKVGMYVTGGNVARGTYVASVDSSTEFSLNVAPPSDGTSVTLTFTRHKYLINYRQLSNVTRLVIRNCQFDCNSIASALMLSYDGIGIYIHLCRFVLVLDRAITDIYDATSGCYISHCDITWSASGQTTGIGIISSSNDIKIVGNRITTCLHHMILHGSGNLIVGNHWWGGQDAGLILTYREYKTLITGNYIDNSWIELSDETANHATASVSIGGVVIVGNIFTIVTPPATSWRWIYLAPHVTGRYIRGISVVGNTFKCILSGGSTPARVDGIKTADGTIETATHEEIYFRDNSYYDITASTESPKSIELTVGTAAATWTAEWDSLLPFGGKPMQVQSVVLRNIRYSNNAAAYEPFFVYTATDLADEFNTQIRFGNDVKGSAFITASTNVVPTAT